MTLLPLPCPAFEPDLADPWLVIHTKSRQEKALSTDLDRLGVRHFLPLIRHLRYYGKRKASVEEPLFPGYVFLRGPIDQAYQADRTRRVANIIPVADQGRIDWELRNLYLAIGQEITLDPYPHLVIGKKVRVGAGPMLGLEGFVEERLGWNRLVLTVRMLGQACSLEVNPSLLEIVD
ncbi:MAG: transcription termination/antitermination NusG family protein [Phycisphaerae bacterium]|nr:transcription termination/antitermination NusG family protein [Tepidisphaeraceae bacterium]